MVAIIPTSETKRLILRPFSLADAPQVQQLVNVSKIADNTLFIPYPYPDDAAAEWIGGHQQAYEEGNAIDVALVERSSGLLCGAMGLTINRAHNRAELGYWLGVEYWNRGYITEAAGAVCNYGFATLGLERIQACHFISNVASGRVMQKLGMAFEGVRRSYYRKNGVYVDIALYGVLREDWHMSE